MKEIINKILSNPLENPEQIAEAKIDLKGLEELLNKSSAMPLYMHMKLVKELEGINGAALEKLSETFRDNKTVAQLKKAYTTLWRSYQGRNFVYDA